MSRSEANDLQGSLLPLVCLAVVLSSCCLSCALTGPLSFVSPVLSSLSPSLSLSQPDYSSVYGSPPPVELVSFTAVRCWQPSSCLFLSFLSCYAITSLLDMGLFSRRCPLALLTGVSTMRAVILSFPPNFFFILSLFFSLLLHLPLSVMTLHIHAAYPQHFTYLSIHTHISLSLLQV